MSAAAEQGLAALRAEIDALDTRLVALLAERLSVVDRVIAVKATAGLPALIPDRVEEVVAHVRGLAAAGAVPPDLAEAVWRTLIDWVCRYEEERLGSPARAEGP